MSQMLICAGPVRYNLPVITELPEFLLQVALVSFAYHSNVLRDHKSRPLHHEVIKGFHEGPPELPHEIHKGDQERGALSAYAVDDHTFMNSQAIFDKAKYFLTDLSIQIDL